MKNLLNTSTDFMNDSGSRLHEKERKLVQFYEQILVMILARQDKNNNKNGNTIAEMDSPDSFIEYFIDI